MPLYDPNAAMGCEVPALDALADLIASSTAAHSLVEATGTDEEKKAKALAKIVVGPHEGPWDGDKFTVAELESRFVTFQIYSPEEGGKQVIVDGWDFSMVGDFVLIIRRWCRAEELLDRQDAYKFFVDRVDALEAQLGRWMVGREGPRLKGVQRQQLGFGTKGQKVAQGEYLFAVYTIPWGDFVDEQ